MRTRSLSWCLAGALAGLPLSLALSVAQSPRAAADIPIRKVVLFSSGVGYFEHAGTVRGNASTELRFRTSQINDILKSIVLDDQGGGRVGAITYPSQDPIAKTLASFEVDISGNPSLAQLLNQLRGARVAVDANASKLDGTVMGVETHRSTNDKGATTDEPVLDLLTGATIRSVPLSSVTSLTFDDPQLQDELTRALGALAQARDQDKKPVTITFTGSGERPVRIGYVVETPVWKTSYRLVMHDSSRRAQLQGWAIVENQTESDWNDVSLSLVSGRPISFMMDLYRPLYATRPTVVPEAFAGLRPQVYDDGIAARDSVSLFGTVGGLQKSLGAGNTPITVTGLASSAPAMLNEVVVTSAARSRFDATESVAAIAAAKNLGALFHYTVPDVTLARQKSAMLPIVADQVNVERVSIYNPSVLASNPLTGVRLENTSGKHLLQGPITVLDDGSYAGDARIDDVPPGQERLLSYGIDLDVHVDASRVTENSAVLTAKIVKGTLVLSHKYVQSRTYAADNKSAHDKTLIVEHPVMPGWRLVDTPAPMETTPAVYRFKGAMPAHKVTTLTVKQELVSDQSVAILPADVGQLLAYSRTGEIPAAVRNALARAAELKQAAADAQSQVAATAQRIADITAEQNRIRENMRILSPNTAYYQRLLAKLNEQESSIEQLQAQRDQLAAKRDAANARLNEYLNTLTID